MRLSLLHPITEGPSRTHTHICKSLSGTDTEHAKYKLLGWLDQQALLPHHVLCVCVCVCHSHVRAGVLHTWNGLKLNVRQIPEHELYPRSGACVCLCVCVSLCVCVCSENSSSFVTASISNIIAADCESSLPFLIQFVFKPVLFTHSWLFLICSSSLVCPQFLWYYIFSIASFHACIFCLKFQIWDFFILDISCDFDACLPLCVCILVKTILLLWQHTVTPSRIKLSIWAEKHFVILVERRDHFCFLDGTLNM